jgi:broad specificity phosphatase PhoE
VQIAYFITHPGVMIDPAIPVPQWRLSSRGIDRMRRILTRSWIRNIRAVYCSTERKAVDGAAILADFLGLSFEPVEAFGENDCICPKPNLRR